MLDGKGGKAYTPRQIVQTALRYKAYYGKNGGVTFGGGEPLFQAKFLLEAITELKKHGIHTCVDTSGIIYAPEVLDIAGLIILDIKHTDKDGFYKLTGCDIGNTLKTLEYLSDNNLNFWVRQVIIPGFNDNEENIKRLKAMAAKAKKIELLPYHAMARQKYESLGRAYPKEIVEPSEESMIALRAIISEK